MNTLLTACLAIWGAAGAAAPGSQPMQDLMGLVESFAAPTFGVAEARARLGLSAKETRDHGNGFQDLELVPAAGMARVVLETQRGELIGIQLDLPEGGAPFDLTALQQRWGRAKRGVAPLDSFLPQPFDFELRRPEFLLLVYLQPGREAAARPSETAVPITDVILRRIPNEELVPEAWKTEDDLVALVRLVLRARPLEPVSLYGALGVFAGQKGLTITLSRVEARNMAGSTVARVAEPAEPPEVAGVATAFLRPIAIDVDRLAKKVGAARVEAGAKGPRLVLAQGTLELELTDPTHVVGLRFARLPPGK